jgi:predicted SAM-dependent methyltransferase
MKNIKKQKQKQVKPLRIDLGCGQNCTVGEDGVKFTGVDWKKCKGVDVVHDLTKFPYPFKDNSVDEIASNHFIEHLDGDTRCKFVNECYRILKMGGKMVLTHPYAFSERAVQDWTHKWPPIVSPAYAYFDKNWREANKLDHYYPITADFEYNVYVNFHGEKGQNWTLKNEETRNFAMAHYINCVADLIVHLKKR